jgi:hypothetical protein
MAVKLQDKESGARCVDVFFMVAAKAGAKGREILHGAQGDQLAGEVADGGAFEAV